VDNRARAATIRKVERKIRARYRKRCWVVFFVALLIGIALGILACGQGWFPVKGTPDAATVDEGPLISTVAPVPTEPATPTPAPTEAPVSNTYVETTPAPTAVVEPEATEGISSLNELAAYFGLAGPETAAPTTEVALHPVVTPPPATQVPATQAPIITPAPTPTPTIAALLMTATPDPSVQGASLPEGEPATPVQAVVDPNAKGSKTNPVRIQEPFTFETQVLADGSRRIDVSNTNFETVKLTMSMDNYLMPDYFAAKYANRYKLTGFEAGTEISLTVESSTGSMAFIPQNAIWITFESASGEEIDGYQLMDAEIAGRYEVAILPGETFKIYKRFAYSADPQMEYMVVTYYLDGQAHKVYFKLEVAAPSQEYAELKRGDRGDAAKALQERLIALGYLNDTADGIFGATTETAVREAQGAGGMAQTGIADSAFQNYIFSQKAVPKS